MAAPERGGFDGYCNHIISPGLLNFCRLYRDPETGAPRKCKALKDLFECPNDTRARHPEILEGVRVREDLRKLARTTPLSMTRDNDSEPELETEEEAAP